MRIIVEKDGKIMMNIFLIVGVVGLVFVLLVILVGLLVVVISKYCIKV